MNVHFKRADPDALWHIVRVSLQPYDSFARIVTATPICVGVTSCDYLAAVYHVIA